MTQLLSDSFIFFLALFGLMESFYIFAFFLTIWTFENYTVLSYLSKCNINHFLSSSTGSFECNMHKYFRVRVCFQYHVIVFLVSMVFSHSCSLYLVLYLVWLFTFMIVTVKIISRNNQRYTKWNISLQKIFLFLSMAIGKTL